MNKNVLLINDLAGYGKVALSVMIPVLSHMEVEVNNLPTALVSNTLDYGKFDILDTTQYMKNTLKVWEELNFHYDAIATGFIVNEEQAHLIQEYCQKESENGVIVLCDPIMADEGKLYPGIQQETVNTMRTLISCADYIVPNFTEATLLTNELYSTNPSKEHIVRIIDKLRTIGSKSIVITSVEQNGKHSVWCYDHKENRYFDLPYENIPVRLPGTGDIFSSVLLGSLANGKSLENSVQEAMNIVKKMIQKHKDTKDPYKGIPIERSLKEI